MLYCTSYCINVLCVTCTKLNMKAVCTLHVHLYKRLMIYCEIVNQLINQSIILMHLVL